MARIPVTAAPEALAPDDQDCLLVPVAACRLEGRLLAGRHDRPDLRLHCLPGCRDFLRDRPSRPEEAVGDNPGCRSNSEGQGRRRNIRCLHR